MSRTAIAVEEIERLGRRAELRRLTSPECRRPPT